MTDERLGSIIGKFRNAATIRDQRAEEEAARLQRVADLDARMIKLWPEVRESILAEVEKLNAALGDVGYKLHTGIDDIDDVHAGTLVVAFTPIGYRDGRLDRLRFTLLKTGTFRASFGTSHMSPFGSDAGLYNELDAERVRKMLYDFLEANVPD